MLALMSLTATPSRAACEFEPQGEGRVAEIIDGRTFRMDDGREVRLAGIEPGPGLPSAEGAKALGALIAGRDVTLHALTDAPDRYGRQPAFVMVTGSRTSVQRELLASGFALASASVADPCAMELAAAEAGAREGKQGLWDNPTAIKNAERPDDILAEMGRFAVVEGKVLSAKLAGATFYINFGRRWTRDFAVTISRRMMPSFEAAGIDLKSLANKRIRIRGWIVRHGGPPDRGDPCRTDRTGRGQPNGGNP
ncbi:thermonuclease family protein [Afipia sp. Root123D2]|uniref:thermonuclease family protein n=1 Tax=Afipia sp. Root123D2 TaxID=1736436 RepID=UPI000A71666C